MTHDETVRKILSGRTVAGTLKSRESNTVEFKESFNKNSTAKYAKTMAAYSNNRGGYIIFGVKDNPRKIVGFRGGRAERCKSRRLWDPAFEGAVCLSDQKLRERFFRWQLEKYPTVL